MSEADIKEVEINDTFLGGNANGERELGVSLGGGEEK
jgi:hypothetical protein